MKRQLLINPELCTGCGLCELACAISKTGQYQPGRAYIRVWREEVWGWFIPIACHHCVEPPCRTACLMNAIYKDPATGLTARQPEQCIGCRACELACPFGAARFDYVEELVFNCDHCGGEPECVKYCISGALQYGRMFVATAQQRRDEALKRLNLEKPGEAGPG